MTTGTSSGAAFGIAQGILGTLTSVQGSAAQQESVLQGGAIAAGGALLSASGLRQRAQSILDATEFNLQINSQNNLRKLTQLSRSMQRTLGRQLSQQASTGLSLTSKSFLQIQSETANQFDTAIQQLKIDAENVQRATIYDSLIKQTNLENEARAKEYQAQAQMTLTVTRAAGESLKQQEFISRGVSTAGSQLTTLLNQSGSSS